ncbi:MAG: DUF1259 domain-containing protein [Planctomycetales bacterium]|nr:DUF1259 domain-containing protein [Planctomycetales bacterium]
MKSSLVIWAVVVPSFALGAAEAQEPADPWRPIGEILGKPGDLAKDGSYKVTILRTDVAVKGRMGLPIPAAMGLNSYAAFVGTPEDATAVGDTCCLEHEIDPVLDALRAGGIEVVALHNHMTIESPRLFFMHFQGRGPAAALARTIRACWNQLGKPAPPPPEIPVGAKAVEPDWKEVAKILGREGPPPKDGVYKVTLPRTDLEVHLSAARCEFPPDPDPRKSLPVHFPGASRPRLWPGVGLACWAAFYACPCGRTMVMGDTCVTLEKLSTVLDALRSGGIHVTGIHNHFLGESRQVMFVHFEAEGRAPELATTIRVAWEFCWEQPGGQNPWPTPRRVDRVEEMKIVRARVALLQIVSVLGLFRADVGRSPTTGEGLSALVTRPADVPRHRTWNGPYLEVLPADPWGNAYRYVSPAPDGKAYDLWSSGPDREDGTPDDVRAAGGK